MQSQQTMQQQVNSQAQAQQQQMMMMNQNGMQGQMPRNPTQQPPQQGFQHLQHQMQASPLPPQQPQAMPNGPPNDGVQQNIPQNTQLQPNGMPLQIQQGPGRPINAQQNQPTGNDAAEVQREAMKLFSEASEHEKANLRTALRGKMTPAQAQTHEMNGGDIAFFWYRGQALSKWRARQASMGQAQGTVQGQQSIMPQHPQNGPAAAPMMQQQRSMNPSPMNGQPQPPTTMSGGPDFNSFLGNMENLIGQQQQAGVLAQEAGQIVVPVSAPRNSTPQPNVTMPGQAMNMNERSASNPMARAQAQQNQMFNAQQSQRMQQQQSQQAQARAQAQMGLQGQPGGMPSGPMPPQQSPAMNPLNTPLRTPSQQPNLPEAGGMNQNPHSGQPLDPRFTQTNQMLRFANAMNGFNPAMLRDMAPEQRQQFAAMPPEKMNEIAKNWQAQQNQMPQGLQMQGNNNTLRPGPPGPPGPPSAQFTQQQNALSQWMMRNPGQRPPPALLQGLTPPQQMLLQQQMQARPGSVDPRVVQQMDNMDIPPSYSTHHAMIQGYPQEIKKWGQLKQWVSSNPTLGPQAIESVKNMQKMHFLQLNKHRQQMQQQQLNPMGTAAQVGGPTPMAMAPRVIAAPVAPMAPMGPNPVQAPNGMNMGPGVMRQITPQEIMNIRNHPSAKFANATDEQIRGFLYRTQINNMQAAQQRQAQQANITQVNGQQVPQNVQPGLPNANQINTPQQAPPQMPQQKPASSAPDPSGPPVPAPANRPRPATNNKSMTAQSSPPTQLSKNNLKRASSDDVVEVPNPNGQQHPPAASSMKVPPRLTEEQIARLDPEQRKGYEAALRQQSQARQQAGAGIAAEVQKRFREIAAEEEKFVMDNAFPEIPMDEESKKNMISLLTAIVIPFLNVQRAFMKWFMQTRDDNRARQFLRTVSFQSA